MMLKVVGNFNIPAYLLNPKEENIKGVIKKIYPEPTKDDVIFISFKSFGGTEVDNNGVFSVENTAVISTWYREDIKNSSRIILCDDNSTWEILNIEDIEKRHQWIRIKVKSIVGGA